ncbi:unnamed protein product, partial [Rotaria socialis]
TFVPYHLGLKHITRETAIEQHQTAIATILHTNKPNQLCVIADATYLFMQKSIDRGFRDVIPTIKNFGYQAAMPSFLNQREQLSIEDANYTCLITKVRWVIESVNGQVKQWKYFFQTIQNSSLRFISNYLDITCAIINDFFPKPVSDIRAGVEIAYRSYQVKQAISYIQEHLTPSPLCDDEPELIVELSWNDDNIVRARFSSLHINKKPYVPIIQHDIKNLEQLIIGWYCTCMSGRCDVDCYVHVVVLLWLIGVYRAEIDLNDHPLSTSNIFLEIIDSIQFYDVQTSDDEDVTTDDEI